MMTRPPHEAIKDFLVDQLSLGVRAATTRIGIGGRRSSVRSLAWDGTRPHDARLWRVRWLSGSASLHPAGGWSVALIRDRTACRRPRLLGSVPRSRWRIMAIIILAVSVWAVRRVTAPLGSLATAAERLGHDVNAPPLPEAGTTETRLAARAFNDMQTRLRSLIENRTRLLAAISHDLRTPLTLLRLRTETVENAQERDKMLSTIAEMDSLIGATLQFARDENASEPRGTDLTALLQSVVDDMSDAGLSGPYGDCRAHFLRMPAGSAQTRGPQPARQRRQIRKIGQRGDPHVAARRSRSISTMTGQESPRTELPACSSRSIGSRNRAAARRRRRPGPGYRAVHRAGSRRP